MNFLKNLELVNGKNGNLINQPVVVSDYFFNTPLSVSLL